MVAHQLKMCIFGLKKNRCYIYDRQPQHVPNRTTIMKYILISVGLWAGFATSAQQTRPIFDDIDQLYTTISKSGLVDYEAAAVYSTNLDQIVDAIANVDGKTLSTEDRYFLYINAYNILTINQVLDYMPLTSVKRAKSFFQRKHKVAGRELSLNQIEAELQKYDDARIHLALVCGAVSCPPLSEKPYRNSDDLDIAVAMSLGSPQVFQMDLDQQKLYISNIFRWYTDDFDGVQAWLSDQLDMDFTDYSIEYLTYDWSLNAYHDASDFTLSSTIGTGLDDESRYFASRLYDKGQFEVNVFNNYYSQVDPGDDRYSFHTTTITYLRGVNNRLNVGLDMRIRGVSRSIGDGRFDALRFANDGFISESSYTRSGISAIGPRIKYQPWKQLGNVTVQHILFFPTMRDAGGNNETGFIDWGSPVLWNDLFFDQGLGAKSSIFVQAGLYLENINRAAFRAADGYWQLSTPVTLIYNYFASTKSTFYALLGSSPRWGYSVSNGGDDLQVIPDDFSQFGAGYKYFITDEIQAEVLYTRFNTVVPGRSANTYNLGVRYYHW